MKIGIDLRFIWENLYSKFVIELVNKLLEIDKENIYNIYLNKEISNLENENTIKNLVEINKWSIKEQISFLKILKNDNNHIMIFFNENKPIFYKKDYIIVIDSLRKIYFQDFDSYTEKTKYFFLLKNSLKKAKKIICFDKNTTNELIERFNIEEKKINILKAFFPNLEHLKESSNIKIDIRTVNNINNDFIIYQWWAWIQKNLERLINVMKKVNTKEKKLDLVILWDLVAKDITLRNIIIKNNLQKNIFFLWTLNNKDKRNYYKQSIWVVFPSLYESFPFYLNEAIAFKVPIISSNYKNIKNIFWDSIKYFSPISESDIEKELLKFIQNKPEADYTKIIEEYSKENTVKSFLDIIIKYN